jgi:hypothetical protein
MANEAQRLIAAMAANVTKRVVIETSGCCNGP